MGNRQKRASMDPRMDPKTREVIEAFTEKANQKGYAVSLSRDGHQLIVVKRDTARMFRVPVNQIAELARQIIGEADDKNGQS